MKKILALSGGSVKGSWEAGAIKSIIEKGFKPDVIYGISVGNLNGAFLTDKAAKFPSLDTKAWEQVAQELEMFWRDKITGKGSVIRNRTFGMLSIVWDILFSRFNGFYKTTPLDSLIDKVVSVENLRNSPVEFFSGTANMSSGEIEYYSSKTDSTNIINAIKASKAMALIFEGFSFESKKTKKIDFFLDGGVLDVVPLGNIIRRHQDISELVIVSVHPNKLDPVPPTNNFSNFNVLSERLSDMISNENATTAVKLALAINAIVHHIPKEKMPAEFVKKNYKKTKIHYINPASVSDFNINIQNFNTNDVMRLFKNGYETAQRNFNYKADSNYSDQDFLVA